MIISPPLKSFQNEMNWTQSGRFYLDWRHRLTSKQIIFWIFVVTKLVSSLPSLHSLLAGVCLLYFPYFSNVCYSCFQSLQSRPITCVTKCIYFIKTYSNLFSFRMTSITLSRISSSFIFSVEVSEFSIVFSNEYLSKLNKDDEKDLDIIRINNIVKSRIIQPRNLKCNVLLTFPEGFRQWLESRWQSSL